MGLVKHAHTGRVPLAHAPLVDATQPASLRAASVRTPRPVR
jgi:hypothetical protein